MKTKAFLISLVLGFVASTASAIEIVRDMSLESPNPEAIYQASQANKKRMEYHFARNHVGIELMVAEGTWSQIESVSGHAFIRFIDEDQNPLNDTVITFNMVPLDSSKMYDKAFGGFPNVPLVQSFSESMISYMKQENRPIRRFILPATPQIITNLKTILRQVIEVPSLIKDYNFIQNNCLSGVLKVLKYVGYPIHEVGLIDIPAIAGNVLMMNAIAFYPTDDTFIIRGGSDLIEKLNSKFGSNFIVRKIKGEEKNDMLKRDEFWAELRTWSSDDLERLMIYWPLDWISYLSQFQKIYDEKVTTKHALLDIVGIKNLSPYLYRLCNATDANCREPRKQAAIALFGEQLMRTHTAYAASARNREIKRSEQLGNVSVRDQKLKLLNNPIANELQLFSEDFKAAN